MSNTIRPRRLFVSGGSNLSANAAILWKELGHLLASEKGLIVLTGGLASRGDRPKAVTADRMIIAGMEATIEARGGNVDEHIETILPDAQRDWNQLIRFKVGRIRVLKNRNAQSRRFSMVHSADVIVSIEGERGTRSVLDVALAIDRPILPLPFGGGASREAWDAEREDIRKWFQIDRSDAKYFENLRLGELETRQIRELAAKVHEYLLRGFTQGCFVIMQFHADSDPVFEKAIVPALLANGFHPWRTDRSVASGDVVTAIRDGIKHCYFVIADTTGDRPNVMYELGLAHATNKPVILLRRLDPDGSLPAIPFDFQTQKIHEYSKDLDDLRRRLESAIAVMSGRHHEDDEL